MVVAERTNVRVRERWEGVLVLFVHELAKYLKDSKEN